ncbi:MAG: MFS transporter [Erysipelotrichaceae bacterium]|nr:MFS transporter [Erysipelotrichaceae bacterium]
MAKTNNMINDLGKFYVLWFTQSLSQLGSSISAFALTLWLYEKSGSALSTAALSICTYLPYVAMSIFAGAISDRFDKKKTMLWCDVFAALCTIIVFFMYKNDLLEGYHLYFINALTGLMNTIQQPASEVAYTIITPKEYYQKTSALQYLSRSVISVGSPLIASLLYGFAKLDGAIYADLLSFSIAFIVLLFFNRIPETQKDNKDDISFIQMTKEGLSFLKENRLILDIMLFMSGVNLVASAFDAVLPALVIPNPRGGNTVLGIVTSCSGIAMVIGSIFATNMPKPKNRVRVIYLTMLFALGIENFLLAFSRNPIMWCIGQVIGWILVPVMSANENVIMKNVIPMELMGRIYACRNTFQFSTIPLGLFLGGFLTDNFAEPFMAANASNKFLTTLFGVGKGSGAALMMFILGVAGIVVCLVFGKILEQYEYSD